MKFKIKSVILMFLFLGLMGTQLIHVKTEESLPITLGELPESAAPGDLDMAITPSEENLIIENGSSGNTISWTITANSMENPTYSIYSSPYSPDPLQEGTWESGVPIEFNLDILPYEYRDSLPLGIHQYLLIAENGDVTKEDVISVIVKTDLQPVKNWGINAGDELEFTTGFNINIDFPDELWVDITEYLTSMLNLSLGYILTENIDIKTIYENFIADIPININIKADILDIFSYEYFYEGYYPYENDSLTTTDIVLTTISTKLLNATSYGSVESIIVEYIKLLKDFVVNPNNLPSSFGNQIGSLLNESTSSITESSGSLIPRPWISYSNDTYFPDILVDLGFLSGRYTPYYYYYGYINSPVYPLYQIFQWIPIFVPTDMNFVEPFEKGKDLMTTMGILTGNTIEDYLSDFGITGVTVLPKSAEIFFDYGTMNETFVDSLGLYTQIQYILTNLYSVGIQIDSDSLSVTGNARISYDAKGILSEFHVEATLNAETINGSPLSVNIAFNIINGETDDGYTIPGYPLIYLILTISVVSLIIIQKTKKSLKKKV